MANTVLDPDQTYCTSKTYLGHPNRYECGHIVLYTYRACPCWEAKAKRDDRPLDPFVGERCPFVASGDAIYRVSRTPDDDKRSYEVVQPVQSLHYVVEFGGRNTCLLALNFSARERVRSSNVTPSQLGRNCQRHQALDTH